MNKSLTSECKPTKLENVVGHTEILRTITSMVNEGTIRNFTFFGETPGTGKTLTAELIGLELFGDDSDMCVHNFNASMNSSVEFIRDELSTILSQSNISGYEFVLFIIDEADGTSKQYQFALRRFIEDNETRAKFILICNNLGKIIRALQSRCKPLFFAPLFERDIITRLQKICKGKHIEVADGVLQRIAEISEGSLRNAISTLDMLRFLRRKIKIEDVSGAKLAINRIAETYVFAKQGKFISARAKSIETMKEFGIPPDRVVSSFMDICMRDKKISMPIRAQMVSEIGRTHYEMGNSLSQMIQMQSLFARIAYICQAGA